MTKVLMVANWKMSPQTMAEAKKLYEATKKAKEKVRGSSVVVAPPSIFLYELASKKRERSIAFAVQNAHFETSGAYTGDISFVQAKNAGASYAIIGHAERRAIGETNEDVRKKVSAALAANITPIICIGEKERAESGEYLSFVKQQLHAAFTNVPHKKIGSMIVAYEPVWAIGAEEAMGPGAMHEMAIFIRKCIAEMYSPIPVTAFPVILYGGSIEAKNVRDMVEHGDVGGFLVGRASADIKKVTALFDALH